MMHSKFKLFLTTILIASAAIFAFYMLPSSSAQAKRLPTIPSKLQGYWYTYDTTSKKKRSIDRVYLHITAKEIESSVIGEKTMKQGLYTLLNTHLDGKEIITRKQKVNKMKGNIGENRTETFNQVKRNRWNTYAIFSHGHENAGYLTKRYALTGKKNHYKLFVQGDLYTEKARFFNKKPLGAHEKRSGKHPVLKYTKISNRYLNSIGIYH